LQTVFSFLRGLVVGILAENLPVIPHPSELVFAGLKPTEPPWPTHPKAEVRPVLRVGFLLEVVTHIGHDLENAGFPPKTSSEVVLELRGPPGIWTLKQHLGFIVLPLPDSSEAVGFPGTCPDKNPKAIGLRYNLREDILGAYPPGIKPWHWTCEWRLLVEVLKYSILIIPISILPVKVPILKGLGIWVYLILRIVFDFNFLCHLVLPLYPSLDVHR
jgi:hypothetical protein